MLIWTYGRSGHYSCQLLQHPWDPQLGPTAADGLWAQVGVGVQALCQALAHTPPLVRLHVTAPYVVSCLQGVTI